ncbi:putative TAT signal protein [Caulobacter phage CcrRogue]|uniref:Putative TAT signal protein n=1 Tax=Caulobacter phage CcrRogue TaxID=2927986 RepID=K4JSM0_9CAUD|nr:putative TAT signal protein [Caulobacter phage CcrRogue]AFU86743.1 putative TAT signal protein [Caulobacter phage CcrRogue]
MNRRNLLLGAGAAVIAAGVAQAKPVHVSEVKPTTYTWYSSYETGIRQRDTHDTRYTIRWEQGAMQHPHADIVRKWVRETIDSGYLYCFGDIHWMDRKVRLEDVHIVIRPGKKVWNHVTGYTDEEGLQIEVNEAGAVFAPFGLASTHGLTYVRESMRDTYYVRKPYLRYDEERELRFALGDDPQGYRAPNSKVGFDDRMWTEVLKDLEAKKAQA